METITSASRTLTLAEKNYNLHIGKLEFLTLEWAITENFRDFFYYAKEFTVFSDNNPTLLGNEYHEIKCNRNALDN